MFDGMNRRIVCMWFPRLASNRVLRACPIDGAFALVARQGNAERLHCLNAQAERAGLHRGMGLADARAFCPDLISRPATPEADARFLATLRRWAIRWCPWVGIEGADGLVLDVTGAAHLWGGEAAMLADMRGRAARAGLDLRLGLGATRGAAWARAHCGTPDQPLDSLPVTALRLDGDTCTALERMGLRRIGDLAGAPRAPLARRFGPELLLRLDQALGRQDEPITPAPEPPHYGVRLTLSEPVGLLADAMAATERLLGALCAKLQAQNAGARRLVLTLFRVDRASQQVELRLAAPLRAPERILPLFERGLAEVDAGFGIDQIRLEATLVEPLPAQQTGLGATPQHVDRLTDLITRIGARIGLENVQRFLPADSHIPERSFLIVPAAYSAPESGWRGSPPRPLRLFPPEPITVTGSAPPARFHWRRMELHAARATGPERIAPEWWLADEGWRSGVRDYWRIDTRQGRRLWLFHTPQNPGWYVQGEFA
ncbi:Y-family DNA polymerase [Phaeovulum sp.]|jgi:protein ImuB|uniref:Y-family DNA polymerase n=1 Tax=Phaeovulum sp. TaxID=2934796 RepID=UPI002730D56D|nr:DNA polymerase Y family protein [Phaeovulum sp.]MDP1667584.1 DNA polymerase Y family protein [Phaeovulum sp.]MDZ4118525.1 DNA polymerase Y family protein [Phaeovulum sp.]